MRFTYTPCVSSDLVNIAEFTVGCRDAPTAYLHIYTQFHNFTASFCYSYTVALGVGEREKWKWTAQLGTLSTGDCYQLMWGFHALRSCGVQRQSVMFVIWPGVWWPDHSHQSCLQQEAREPMESQARAGSTHQRTLLSSPAPQHSPNNLVLLLNASSLPTLSTTRILTFKCALRQILNSHGTINTFGSRNYGLRPTAHSKCYLILSEQLTDTFTEAVIVNFGQFDCSGT